MDKYLSREASELFPDIVADRLPDDPLDIAKDQWDTKFPELAVRALNHLHQNQIDTTELISRDPEGAKNFLLSFGKPWKHHFFTTALDRNELQLLWDNYHLRVQANSEEELLSRQGEIREKLKAIIPPVEIDENAVIDQSEYFHSKDQIAAAIERGELVSPQTVNIVIGQDRYVGVELAQILEQVIDPALDQHKNVFFASSATRTLDLQALLVKLGYPAAIKSYHTLGRAIDFILSEEASARFRQFLETAYGENGHMPKSLISDFYRNGGTIKLSSLIEAGLLPMDLELCKAYDAVSDAIRKQPAYSVSIIDETSFFIQFDKDGEIVNINPVFHIQHEYGDSTQL